MPELSLRFHGASSGSYGIGPCERTIQEKKPKCFSTNLLKNNSGEKGKSRNAAFSPGLVGLKSPQSPSPWERDHVNYYNCHVLAKYYKNCCWVFQLSMLGNGPCIICISKIWTVKLKIRLQQYKSCCTLTAVPPATGSQSASPLVAKDPGALAQSGTRNHSLDFV